MPAIEKRLGHKVTEFRLALGLTQAQLAEKADISVESISRLERGKTIPSLKTLDRIAKILKTSLSQLFAFGESSKKSQEFEKELAQINASLRGLNQKQLGKVHRVLKVVVEEL